MAHERTYSEDDPHLAELRRAALAFPEAVEVEAWGRPTFRAGKKIFAMFTEFGEDGRFSVVFRPEPEERAALLDDKRFYKPPYWGPSGWLALDFTAADVDWSEVAELLESSYRQVALKRMIAKLPDRSNEGIG